MIDFPMISIAHELGWFEYREAVKKMLRDNDIDTLFIFAPAMMKGLNIDSLSMARTCLNGYKKSDVYGMNFNTAIQQYVYIHFIAAASEVCDNVYHYIVDPTEPDYSQLFDFNHYRNMYYLSLKRQNSIVMPFYEYGLKNYCTFDCDKNFEFIFGASALMPSRDYLREAKDYFEQHEGWDCNIITKANRDVRPQGQYFWDIAHARYSLVVPSYDVHTFSIQRLFECAFNDCLAFVLKSCDLQDVSCFPDIVDIIMSELLIDSIYDVDAKIASFAETKRKQVVCDIMNSESIKKITNLDWLRDRWQSLRGLGGTK